MRRVCLLLCLCGSSASLFPATWNLNANGNWDVNANWTAPAVFPNAIDATAIFGNVITANRVVTLGIPITIGTITFDNNSRYTITSNTLTFQVSSGMANMVVTNVNGNGAHIVASTVSLANDLLMSHSSSAAITISGQITGPSSLIKTGTGTGSLVLSNGTNNYGGSTTINQGNLTYGANGSIPTTSLVTVGDGISTANLIVAASMTTGNELQAVVNTNGTITPNNNITVLLSNLAGSGSVVLTIGNGNTNLFSIAGSSSTTFSGSISGGLGNASTNPATNNRLVKGGTSTLTLSGSSTYASRTFISQGILDVQSSTALGLSGSTSAVYVQAIGTQGSLYIDGNGLGISKTLFLNGPGFASGALRNMNGNNSVSGNIQIGWTGGTETPATDATIQVDPGTQLTAGGIVSGISNLSLVGGGTLIYSGVNANTMSGTTNINAGTLQLNKTGVNAIAGNATINTGTLITLAPDQIANTSVVTINGAAALYNMFGNADTIGSLVFNAGMLSQGGATLSLASAAATALSMSDGTTISGDLAFTAAGGVTYTGVTTQASVSGNVNLGSFSHTFNINNGADTPDMDFSGIISGTGSIVKSTGIGFLQFSGTSANNYSGVTTINAGTINLNKTANVTAIQGNVTINAGGTLLTSAQNQFSTTSLITLSGGVFNLNGFDQSFGRLTFTSGTLTPGGATISLSDPTTALSLGNGVTVSANVNLLAGSGSVDYTGTTIASTISGNLDLGSSIHVFNVNNGTATPDMIVSGIISGTGGITKAGTGRLDFTGTANNPYSGLTTVSSGILFLNNSVPSAVGGDVNLNNAAGSLVLGSSNQIADTSTVTIAGGVFNMSTFSDTIGTLIFNNGTLTQVGGTLSLANAVTALQMRNTTISGSLAITNGGAVIFDNTNNGTATISGAFNLGPITPTFNIADGTAAIDMQISGIISSTGAGVTKTGAGQLNFSGVASNTYSGLTTVSAGTLALSKTAGLNAIPGDVLINGGTLTLAAANQIADTSTVTLSTGTFNLAGLAETIATLNFNGGTLTQGAATLTLASATTALSMRNTTITGNIAVTNGGAVVFDNTNNGTATISGNLSLGATTPNFNIANGTAAVDMLISGVISSTGAGVTKIGAGLLEFSGASANTYSGLTTVSVGELFLNKTAGVNAIGASALINGGTLTLGAAEQIANTATVTLSSGAFNLSGFNETITTLIFNGGTLSQGIGVLSLAGAVTALSMRDTTVPGNLVLTGGGAVIFDNTNNGTATIVGNMNLSGSNTTFNIADGTATIDMQINGIISNGALTKTGTGTLLLTGANTYGGGTLISAGTLQGNSTSLQGNITDNANLVFDQTLTGTYAGSISGTGTLVKQGVGTLTFSSANTIGGTTSVNAGKLVIDNTFGGAGTMSVAAGAALGGIGTISKDTTINGILAPGDSIGTIHFVGNVILASGSLLENELNPATSDLVDVVGTVTIQPGAGLSVLAQSGLYSTPMTYTIIHTTGGVTGTFSSVTNNMTMLTETLVYTPTDVLLQLFFIPFSQLVTKGNAAAVAHCLDILPAPAGSDLASIINILHMLPTASDVEDALLQMQPSALTSLALDQENNTIYVSNAILERLDVFSHSCDLETVEGGHFWISPFGSFTHQGGQGQEPGFNAYSSTPGLLLGLDGAVASSFYFGGCLAATDSHLHWKQDRGTANIQSGYAALYGKWFKPEGYIESSLMGAIDFYHVNRRIKFANRYAKSFHRGAQGSVQLKAALTFDRDHTIVSPFGRLNYLFLHEDGFDETGADSLDLKMKTKNSDLLTTEFGLDLSHCYRVNDKTLSPFIQLSAIRESRFEGRKEKGSLGGQCLMVVRGLNPSRTLVGTAVGLNATFTKTLSNLSFFYQGKYGSKFADHSVNLQFMMEF